MNSIRLASIFAAAAVMFAVPLAASAQESRAALSPTVMRTLRQPIQPSPHVRDALRPLHGRGTVLPREARR
jgi:hypothetical protein